MGYLDNTSITVDAILTKRGRELLSQSHRDSNNSNIKFRITQFALGDDEIDYSLFNESHPNGTQYSAEAIENMPLIEAIPNGAHSMNSKLITLTRGANAIPYISHNYSNGLDLNQGASETITPTTFNLSGGNVAGNEEYIFTILNNQLRNLFEASGGTAVASAADANEFSTIARSESVRGTSLTIQATTSNALFSSTITSATTSIIIEGVTSGAIVSLPLTVNYTNA
jgi:hypothetical protein